MVNISTSQKKRTEQVLRAMLLQDPLPGKWQNYGCIITQGHGFSLASQISAKDQVQFCHFFAIYF